MCAGVDLHVVLICFLHNPFFLRTGFKANNHYNNQARQTGYSRDESESTKGTVPYISVVVNTLHHYSPSQTG